MNEKRNQRRVEVAWIVRLPHRQGGQIQSRTVNVSGSGILFLSPQAFSKNEVVAIEMDVSSGCTLRVIIRIARELPGSTRIHTYGAQFVQFADNGQQRLEETLATIQHRQAGSGSSSRTQPAAPARSAAVAAPAPSTQSTPSRLEDRRWGPRADDSPDTAQRR